MTLNRKRGEIFIQQHLTYKYIAPFLMVYIHPCSYIFLQYRPIHCAFALAWKTRARQLHERQFADLQQQLQLPKLSYKTI